MLMVMVMTSSESRLLHACAAWEINNKAVVWLLKWGLGVLVFWLGDAVL